jgi:hypothetical protein
MPLLMGVDRETRFLMLLEYKDEFNKNNDRGDVKEMSRVGQ